MIDEIFEDHIQIIKRLRDGYREDRSQANQSQAPPKTFIR